MEIYILLGFVLLLSIFLGLELISKVPSTLHTPLMSGANAISGIALVGALMLSSAGQIARYISLWCNIICFNKCIWWLFSN